MYSFSLLLVLSLICLGQSAIPSQISSYAVQNLYPGETHNCCLSPRSRELQTYCYSGMPKHVLHVWQTVLLKVNITSDNFEIYDGGSPEAVLAAYEQHRSSWSFNVLWGSRKAREIKLSPFNRSCIGISSGTDYSVYLHVIRVDYWRVLLFTCGILLFISAPRLCENPLFYYICGTSLGMALSFLIIIYYISKLFPQKKMMMYGFVGVGWTVGVYLIQLLWDNLRTILVDYKLYVASYAAITGFFSFSMCYWFGPVTGERSKTIVKWFLQISSAFMMLFSSQFLEGTFALILIFLALYNFSPKALVSKARSQWKRRFPPKVKLLSEDEYYEQGAKETRKALDELRGYCSSPDCNQWKTVIHLKDPVRFANFVEGKSHLDDSEVLDYETATPIELEFSEESNSDSDSILTD